MAGEISWGFLLPRSTTSTLSAVGSRMEVGGNTLCPGLYARKDLILQVTEANLALSYGLRVLDRGAAGR